MQVSKLADSRTIASIQAHNEATKTKRQERRKVGKGTNCMCVLRDEMRAGPWEVNRRYLHVKTSSPIAATSTISHGSDMSELGHMPHADYSAPFPSHYHRLSDPCRLRHTCAYARTCIHILREYANVRRPSSESRAWRRALPGQRRISLSEDIAAGHFRKVELHRAAEALSA